MRSWVGISFVVVVLIGVTVAWHVWPASRTRATASVAAPHSPDSAGPDVRMVDMHLMAQLGDKTILQVVAKRAVSSVVKQHAIVHGIQARMEQAGRTWNISAARGLVDRVTGDMTAQGGVRLYEADGYVIETEKLSLHVAERILQTDAAVMMHGNAVVIAGTGLRHEIDKNRITLQHQVKASFLYDRAQREAKDQVPVDAFIGGRRVRSFDDGATWSGPTADADPGH